MKADKALDLIATHISSLDGNVAMHEAPSRLKLRQALQALEKFRGALEVDESHNKDLYWFDIYHNGDFKLKRGKYKLYAIPKTDTITQNNQPDWDWDISYWVYSSEYVYDKHNNKRLISDVRSELDNQIYDVPKEKNND